MKSCKVRKQEILVIRDTFGLKEMPMDHGVSFF